MQHFLSDHPEPSEYVAAFGRYVDRVPAGDILEFLTRQGAEVNDFFSRLSPEQANFSYEPGKWSVKELVNHVIDSERVFAYRAMAIARGDSQSLPGFDENTYAANAGVAGAKLADLLEEFAAVRRSSVLLLRLLPESAWKARGTANKVEISVRALAWVMAGHVDHHREIVKSRYHLGG